MNIIYFSSIAYSARIEGSYTWRATGNSKKRDFQKAKTATATASAHQRFRMRFESHPHARSAKERERESFHSRTSLKLRARERHTACLRAHSTASFFDCRRRFGFAAVVCFCFVAFVGVFCTALRSLRLA